MSNSSKMFPSLPPSHLAEQSRMVWGRMFGHCICESRKGACLSIEQTARRAGMGIAEWTAIEEGQVPQDITRLRAMAAAMKIRFDQIVMLVLLCERAWQL
jgi:transcriptional regulator with XRE-family HTH domain